MSKPSQLGIFFVVVVLIVAFGSYQQGIVLPEIRRQRATLDEITERLEQIDQSVALLHFEKDPTGQALDKILGHLDFWAKQMQRHGNSIVERPIIQDKIELGVKALHAIGDGAFPVLKDAFFKKENRSPEKTEFRTRLMIAMKELDPESTKQLAVELLKDPGTTSRLRLVAASVLLDLDKTLAGTVLKDVILRESHMGPRQPLLTGPTGGAPLRTFPGYHDLISYFMQSSVPKEDVLLVVLQRSGHDLATLMAVVESLRVLKSKAAVEHLQKLYRSEGHAYHPRFRQKCLTALAEIAGAAMCPWFEEQLAIETTPLLKMHLSKLIAANCR